ncbi:MAG: PPE domain-containing protein [Actinophytocola sp.]|uniref:PPE domain-containing protein n=1 Tax=Actinophytocola sp. TaxID=1872138 RepID=UPI00132BF61E|nr:PPE domain-containing protein [Actinophytocola sp.]MPZ80589.1 PPE domain-containing protein [Actinophytocola sp.]
MGHRWKGFEHPELYEMINSGPGPAASEPQTNYWVSLTDELSQVDEDLNTRLTKMGSSWEGQAAESAQSGLTPLAAWAGDAETGSTVMRISSENQADYISDARARMPEPVSVTTPAPSTWDKVTAGASAVTGNPGPALQVAVQAADHEMQEAAQSEAQQRAVETMQTYETSSTWNRDTLGTFVAPPDVVVSSPPPQGGTAGHVDPAQSQVNTVAHSSYQSTSSNGYTVPTSGGGGGGSVSPTGGGTTTPQVPNGGSGSVSTPPSVTIPPGSATTPSGITPPSTLPPGTPNPGPTPGFNPPINTNPGPGWQNNTFVPGFGNTNNVETNGRGPLSRGPNGPVNAGDVARKGMPMRGGLPGGGSGLGGGLGGADPEGSRPNSQLGRGGMPGESVVRSGPGAAGAAGRGGVTGPRSGAPGATGAGGRRADGEDDDEHFAPDYLLETDDVFGDDRRVAPTVIGESTPQE